MLTLGITFESSSKLELKAPDTIEELAINTHVELFFNVTQSDVGRSFIFYMGNVDKTHQRMPGTSTDDYMGVEVDNDGLVKLTMDLGEHLIHVPETSLNFSNHYLPY